MSTGNPFWHAGPVPVEKFKGRSEEVRRVVDRIATGQSVAVIGPAGGGKTSFLEYLLAPQHLNLYGNRANQLVFSRLEAACWGQDFTWEEFWRQAFIPLRERIEQLAETELLKYYQVCVDNGFGSYVVERFIGKLKDKDCPLVLVIDDFETVLRIPSLKGSAQFFGGIRSIATRSQGALSVVLSSSWTLNYLGNAVGKATKTGSPYFNYMTEEVLLPWSHSDFEDVLTPARSVLSAEDIQRIADMAGGHPYLVQTLGSCLWESHQENRGLAPLLPHRQALQVFYPKVTAQLERIWQSWPLDIQKLTLTIALMQVEKLKAVLIRLGFEIDKLGQDILQQRPKLEGLKQQGLVAEDGQVVGGWRISPKIFLYFMIDKKLESKYRDKLPSEIWETFSI